MLDEERHPVGFATKTVYVVVIVGLTMIVCVVSPVDHRYEAYPGPASRVTSPQPGFLEDVITGAGGGAQIADIGSDQSSVPVAESVAEKNTRVPAIVKSPE